MATGTACVAGLVIAPATATAGPVTDVIDRLDPANPDEPPPPPPPPAEDPEPPPPTENPEPTLGERIVDEAASHEGTPYRYGADGPDAFDCSGFTSHVFSELGIDLPRTSQQQRDATTMVDDGEARPGDLVFRHDSGGDVYHVAIYAGDGLMWHSPQAGETVQLSQLPGSYSVGRVGS